MVVNVITIFIVHVINGGENHLEQIDYVLSAIFVRDLRLKLFNMVLRLFIFRTGMWRYITLIMI
jgi:hypothetical protein